VTKSIAHIRPQSRMMSQERRRVLLSRRRLAIPPEFRLVTQAPVLQTRDVVSRVILTDGTVVEESLNTVFTMARTVATQTLPVDMVPVVSGAPEGNRENNNSEVNVVIDLTMDEDEDHEDDSDLEEEGEVSENPGPEEANDNNVSDSTGTPVQDEKLP
jgi:hypothetical protein